jgi:hypothetical protein
MTEDGPEVALEQVIASASCVVAANPDVRSIAVVTNRRLTHRELAIVRHHAVDCRVAVRMDGGGTLRLRKSDAATRSNQIGHGAGE